MLPLSALFESQVLRIRQQLRQPYQPVTHRPAASVARWVPAHVHGTLSGYKDYACRCLPCRGANAQRCREQRAAQRERKRAAQHRRHTAFFAQFTRRAS